MRRTIYAVLLALAALAPGLPAAAQSTSTDEDAETTAPVVLDGYTLFQVRGARSYPAERRAGEIADRIGRVAADRSVPVDSLKVRETPVASLVLAEDETDFAFETTLASRSFGPWLRRLIAARYEFHLLFLWLPNPEAALARVAERVRLGGHDVPEVTVRRRYWAGLKKFLRLVPAVGCLLAGNR